MILKSIARIGAVSAAAMMLSFGAASAETLRLNHNLPEQTGVGQSLIHFADRVSELTGGDLTVRVYHNSQLGGQRESIEMVQQGALDMVKTNAAGLEPFEPLYGVFNVPYLSTSAEHAKAALMTPEVQALLDTTADKGFVGLEYLYEGSRSFYTTSPAASLDDLKGRKIRAQENGSAIRMIELLGMQPTPVAFPEVYSALQQGVVDGADGPVAALAAMRHGEVAKTFLTTEHTRVPSVLLISTQTWDRLSDEHKAALKQAADDMFEFGYEREAGESAYLQKVAEEQMGVTVVAVDQAPFIEALAPMKEDAAAASPEAAALIAAIDAAKPN